MDFVMVSDALLVTYAWMRLAGIGAGGVALYVFPLVASFVMYARGLYRARLRLLLHNEVPAIVGAISIAAMIDLALWLAIGNGGHPGGAVVRLWLVSIVLVSAGRAAHAAAERRWRVRSGGLQPAVIIGAGLIGTHVARRLLAQPEYGLRPVGFLDGDPPQTVARVNRPVPLLGTPEDLEAVATHSGIGTVIVAFTSESDRRRIPLLRMCQTLGLDILVVPRFFDTFNQRATLEHVGGLPLLSLRHADPKGWEFAIKHGVDRAVAALLLLVLAPLLVVLAVAVKLSSPGPLLFRQARVGRDLQQFDVLKFRSMNLSDEPGRGFRPRAGSAPGGIEGHDRRTRIGRLLRRTSLDELPQLLNVLAGEMSLVGPRPERPEFVALFEQEIERYGERHRVKAGITGWAQVHGLRGQTSIADRAEWDNYYIENWSLRLDLIILVLTVKAVISRQEA